jgi:hypothetical protein
MSISTNTILKKLKGSPIQTFIANWAMFEEVITNVYRTGRMAPEDTHLLGSLRYAIRDHYNQWADVLHPYWQKVKVGGKRVESDPFLALMDASLNSSFASTWEAIQILPVAREALNLMVSDQGLR